MTALAAIGVATAGALFLSGRIGGVFATVIAAHSLVFAAFAYGLAARATGKADAPTASTSSVRADAEVAPGAAEPRASFPSGCSATELHDSRTGLATRALLRDRLGQALARANRHERPVALMVLDIDGFRSINDAFGFASGDVVLAAVASRLTAILRAGDSVARLGADEFALLLEDMADDSNFVQIADRVFEALARPVKVDDRVLTISACSGVARASADDDADAVLRNADAALAAAKGRGRGNCEVFSERIRSTLVARVDLEAEVRRAVEARAFHLEYQPIVVLENRRIVGVEALLRWHHPVRGAIPPATFLPVVDELGLSRTLGCWVLDQACCQVKRWQDDVPNARALTLTVNVSRAQLRQPELVADVANALELSALEPRRLVLEVSDGVLLDDAGTALSRLRSLKALGVRIAIDDFGARHAAVHQLPRIPVDILKIDKAFIDRMGRSGPGVSVAQVVLALGKSMRLRTVAEGIEAEEQLAELLRLKCEFGQGKLFSRPLSSAGLGTLLRTLA